MELALGVRPHSSRRRYAQRQRLCRTVGKFSERCVGGLSSIQQISYAPRRSCNHAWQVENLVPSKAAKIRSRSDSLQTTFSDKNRMRRSAPVRVCTVCSQQRLFLPCSTVNRWRPVSWAFRWLTPLERTERTSIRTRPAPMRKTSVGREG